MKALFIAGVLAVGAVFALDDGTDTKASSSQDAPWEQGIDRVDGMLQHGMSKGTHDEFAVKAKEGAIWLQGFGEDLKAAAE